MKRTYTFHSDQGHAWLEVPLTDLHQSGIAESISGFSYINGETAYLEEDCDAPKFLGSLRHAGVQVDFREAYIDADHWIRALPHYFAKQESD